MVRENGLPLDVHPLVLDSTTGTIELRAVRKVMASPPEQRTSEGIQLVADWLWEYMKWDYDGMKFEVLHQIAGQAEYRRVNSGSIIYNLRDWDTDQMYIIVAGVVCFVSENKTQVHAVGAGQCFGEYEISRAEPLKRIVTAVAGNSRPTTEYLLVPKDIYKKFLAPSLAMVDSTIFELTKAFAIFRQGAIFPIQWRAVNSKLWREVNRQGRDDYLRKIVLGVMFLLRIDGIYFRKTGRRLWRRLGYYNFIPTEASLPNLDGQDASVDGAQQQTTGSSKLAGVVARCKWTLKGNSLDQRQAVRDESAFTRGNMLLQLVPAVQCPEQPEVERNTAIQLYRTMTCLKVNADRMIYSVGDENKECYVVLSGEVEFQRPAEIPRKFVIGDFFGVEVDPSRDNAAAFFRANQARAKTDVELGVLPQRVYLQHLDALRKRNLQDNLDFAMKLEYCQGLPHPWLVKLARCFTRIKLRKAHQALLRPGDPVTCVFFLVQGSIKVMKSVHVQEDRKVSVSVATATTQLSAQEDLQMKLLSLHTAAERRSALKKASLVVRLEPPSVLGLQEMVHRRDKYDVNITCTSASCTLLALSAEDFKHLFVDGPHEKCYQAVRSSAQKVHNAMNQRLEGRKTSVMNRIAREDIQRQVEAAEERANEEEALRLPELADAEDAAEEEDSGALRWRCWDGDVLSAQDGFKAKLYSRPKGRARDMKPQVVEVKKSDVSPLTTVFPRLVKAANAIIEEQKVLNSEFAHGRARRRRRSSMNKHKIKTQPARPKKALKGLFKAERGEVNFSKAYDKATQNNSSAKLFSVCPIGPKEDGPREAALKRAIKAKRKEREKMKQDLKRIVATTRATKAPKSQKHPKMLNKTSPSAYNALNNQKAESKTGPAISNQHSGSGAPRKAKKTTVKLPAMPDWFTGED